MSEQRGRVWLERSDGGRGRRGEAGEPTQSQGSGRHTVDCWPDSGLPGSLVA